MRRKNKLAALTLLLIHSVSVFYPGAAYALTNGPTQPESSSFQPASVSNLVDPFSGDFSYNIPLLDVDGYPVNLAYSSGGSMDDEASWVGYGWNINPGSITRVMKGIPDDFNGTDKISKDYNIRPDVTGGISFNVSTEIFGLDFLGANASADIFYNNRNGLGVEIGAGITASLNSANHVSGEMTGSLNLGITSNSQTGADFNFGLNIGTDLRNKEQMLGSMGLKLGGSLNSRAGLKSTTLGVSFNPSFREENMQKLSGLLMPQLNKYGSATTQYGMAFNPTISMPMRNESYSLSPQIGVELWGLQFPVQLTGHFTRQKLESSHKDFPAYGFLNSHKGATDPNAIMDFNREKEVPYMDNTPTLPVPYVTPDVFTATSQFGSSQFKANSNSSGVFFDNYGTNKSHSLALGIEFGTGGGIKGGIDLSGNGSNTVTRKWNLNNDFLNNGDFSKATGMDGEDVYFKLVGERSAANKNYLNKIIKQEPVKVRTAEVNDDAKAFSTLASNSNQYAVSSKIARNIREPRGELFSPLSADKAQKFGLDKSIKNYAAATTSATINCSDGVFGSFTKIPRVGDKRKAHHLSEITVTKNDGMRLIYGTPVYNNEQTDVTFNVAAGAGSNNLVTYAGDENSTNNKSGTDFYFSKETVPAYATSFLLNGVCSPDYIDLTGNGISDDDLGTAVKFNYSLVNEAYKWRTPTASNTSMYANYSEGNRSDNKDNKASISYGTKELWYTNSIESKNMIAVFRLGDRDDGFGYNSNGSLDVNSKQKKLERIDLYTKAELINNPSNPVPIKSVHFEYDYSLFGNVPNNNNGGGKLTLKSVYFTYANSNSGSENRYYFTYNASGDFQYQQYDRWGNYKDKSWNNSIAGIDLDNNDFPYSIQDKTKADESAKKWQLSEIELPSGGKIKVDYESDDYAFVQNQRAMQMAKIIGYGQLNNYTNYQKTDKIFIQLPAASTNAHVGWEYFEGINQLYFKSMINVDNHGANELVSGYAKMKSVRLVDNSGNAIADNASSSIAEVTLEKRGDYHPVAAASWQFLRQNLPKLAYPYSVNDGLGPLAFVKALIAAIRNVAELFTPFEIKAMRMGFGSEIIQNKGYARIGNNFMKYGGGVRVKKIIMDDIWEDMAGSGNGNSSTTGMVFDYTKPYTTATGEHITISSGVASYEPMAGSEENPFKQPIAYQQRQHLTQNMFTVEEPLGESYFPAASVGYSQVTIRNLDAEGNLVNNGYSVKKFFTAKDFPTVVKRTDLSKTKYNQSSIFGLFKIDHGNSVVLSQGFYVETNDMHGKPLSDETFDGSNKLLSGSYYHYKSKGSEQLALDNNALTLRPDGTVQNDLIGEEFEMYHDMREQVTDNTGISLNLNLDVLFLTILTVPVPTFIPIVQSTYSGYQSAATIKVVSRYAIEDKVTTIENGSTMTSENVLWDAMTGEVLLTKTQNGFDDPIYNFKLPAYMVNEYERGMGAAYHNTGILFNNVTVASGVAPSGVKAFLVPGDELGVVGTASLLWVMDAGSPGSPDLRLINRDGSMYTGTDNLILLRSGRRNMMGASSYSVVSLKNPIRNGKIEMDQATEILSTTAGTFSDEWTSAAKYVSCTNTGGKIGNTTVPGAVNKNTTVVTGSLISARNRNSSFRPVPVATLNKGGGGSGGLLCDSCRDIGDYSISTAGDCVTVDYMCSSGTFPSGKIAYFIFSDGGVGRIIKIDATHLSGTACGLSISSTELVDWYCVDKDITCPDPCDPSSYGFATFSSAVNSGATCVVAYYKCDSVNLPANMTVKLTFTRLCNNINEERYITITKTNPVGFNCFGEFFACPAEIKFASITCETDPPAGGCCPNPTDQRVNPYYTGLKGNWRNKSTYVYTTDRDPRPDPGNTAQHPTNLRKGGIFSTFTAFYKVQSGEFVPNYNSDSKWIASATVTKVNNKGQEVENVDALNRYSSAQFGFNDLVATAVSSNARENEIGYDGFEDYAFNTSCGTGSYANECNEDGHFNFKKAFRLADGSGFTLTTAEAHTGNYSAKVATGQSNTISTTIRKTVNSLDDLPKYEFNGSKEMILKDGGVLTGFTPLVGKKYVLSGWIKGDVATGDDPGNTSKSKIMIEAYAGITATGYSAIAVKAGPKVEGWTRVITVFELPTGQSIDNMAIRLLAGSSDAYFDDIRIHPYSSNMKSFAYDYKTSRLMAELDENNYATFFEYNDEGQLLRNKKETEKGIVTLKETRSRVRKNSH